MKIRAEGTKEEISCSCLVKREPKHYVNSAHGISKNNFSGSPPYEQDGEGQVIVNSGKIVD